MRDIVEAQHDMRAGYCSGGAGILTSAMMWLAAAVTAHFASVSQSVWVLFIGGMLIHPVSSVLCKFLGGSGNFTKGNPLGGLAIASTFWLIFSLPLAYAAFLQRAEWFFPAMLLVIGGRYLTFSVLFGMRVYWALGFVLAGAAYLLGSNLVLPAISAFVGAAIECAFALVILVLHRRQRA
jgi:hypothetical protein